MHLIAGPSAVHPPVGPTLQRIESTEELERAVGTALPGADVLIMAAAPADYRPQQRLAGKLPRAGGAVTIELEPTTDILMATRALRRPGSLIVGFALETGDAETKARDKLTRKDLDMIVVNDALDPDAGFEVDTNRVIILDRDGGRWEVPLAGKDVIAEQILDRVEARLGA